MMPVSRLESFERYATLAKNIIYIATVIGGAIIYFFFSTSTNVRASLTELSVRPGNEIVTVATETDTVSGKLTGMARLTVSNITDRDVSLRIKFVADDFYRDFFVYINALSSGCHIDDEILSIGKSGLLFPDRVGVLNISNFPGDCHIQVSSFVVGVPSFYAEVYSDSKRVEIERPYMNWGWQGAVLQTIQSNRPVSYVVLWVATMVLLLILAWGGRQIGRRRLSRHGRDTGSDPSIP